MSNPESNEQYSEWEADILDLLGKSPKVLLNNMLWAQTGEPVYAAVRSLQEKGVIKLWLNDRNEVEVRKA